MSSIFNHVIKRFLKTKEEDRYEFLNSYTEFRYFQVINSMHKLTQEYYQKDNPGIKALKEAISSLTRMDHVKCSYTRSNSYHVNTSLVSPHMLHLESTNLIAGAHSEDEYLNFLRCIQPVVNEKALEPPQLTLFNSLYQVDSYRRRLPAQFAGQLVSTHNACSFKSLETALLDLDPKQRMHAQQFIVQQKYVVHDFMEITGDYSISKMHADDVYSLS